VYKNKTDTCRSICMDVLVQKQADKKRTKNLQSV